MRIVYISHLSTNIAAGMNWSVPASIRAQEKIDEVLWINTTNVVMPHWRETKAYRNLKDYGEVLCLEILPQNFRRPHLVVFEGLYFKEYLYFSKELRKNNIPYIIIPRGSLTHQAMHNHAWFKKWIAHKVFFNKFIRHARCIQYLTRQEAEDSKKQFPIPYFIVPNGVCQPSETKMVFNDDKIKAVFIGRIDMYHKGIDILLDAITQVSDELRKAHFSLSFYGPKKYDYQIVFDELSKRKIEDIVTMNGEISGKEKEIVLLNADLFVMTSRFEGHPMGLIEALAYGIPCLITPGTNMAEEVHNSDSGWVSTGNVESIKLTLLKIICESKQLKDKGRNARLLASKYDWNKIALTFNKEVLKLKLM